MIPNDSLLTPMVTPRKVIQQFITTETPVHSTCLFSPFAFTPYQPHDPFAAAREIGELKQQLEQSKIEQQKILAYCQQLEKEVALLKAQLESSSSITFHSAHSQKGLKRARASSPESSSIILRSFDTTRQRLKEQMSTEAIQHMDNFLRTTLLTP